MIQSEKKDKSKSVKKTWIIVIIIITIIIAMIAVGLITLTVMLPKIIMEQEYNNALSLRTSDPKAAVMSLISIQEYSDSSEILMDIADEYIENELNSDTVDDMILFLEECSDAGNNSIKDKHMDIIYYSEAKEYLDIGDLKNAKESFEKTNGILDSNELLNMIEPYVQYSGEWSVQKSELLVNQTGLDMDGVEFNLFVTFKFDDNGNAKVAFLPEGLSYSNCKMGETEFYNFKNIIEWTPCNQHFFSVNFEEKTCILTVNKKDSVVISNQSKAYFEVLGYVDTSKKEENNHTSGSSKRTCPSCHGAGIVKQYYTDSVFEEGHIETCNMCGGSGKVSN